MAEGCWSARVICLDTLSSGTPSMKISMSMT
jgi:hypothetical protein